jgi:hypothetical protein
LGNHRLGIRHYDLDIAHNGGSVMNEYHEIQRHIDEVTMTTAERRHEHQRKEAARRLKQIEDRRNKAALKKVLTATKEQEK